MVESKWLDRCEGSCLKWMGQDKPLFLGLETPEIQVQLAVSASLSLRNARRAHPSELNRNSH